ncbi:hypothetical protein EVJ58_g8201 [Rhodofomes roseus]|uniref:Uncharacterized protein n=1 Tax=Rhodofomes roseus TaxID=34475 RepID=A0A4Y9Y417_9APHY|nr:hypothetical protein EVJ58_g8201 [Rhodofomes roseus]
MLVTLYFLKGIAALRSILILTAGASASWYSQYVDNPTIGPGPLIMTLACILSAPLIPIPKDEPALPEFIELVESPSVDFALWGIHMEDAAFQLLPTDSDVGFLAASGILPMEVDDSVVSSASGVAMSAAPVVDVPELDWTTPEAPTIRVFKAKAAEPVFVTYLSDYVTRFNEHVSSIESDASLPPTVSDDAAVPPIWRYQYPSLAFRKLCLKKGKYSSAGHAHSRLILATRAVALAYILFNMFQVSLLPVLQSALDAWRTCRNALRPPRMIIARRQREYRRLHNRR